MASEQRNHEDQAPAKREALLTTGVLGLRMLWKLLRSCGVDYALGHKMDIGNCGMVRRQSALPKMSGGSG